MDTSKLDLSRFKKMTRKEYYTTDWKIEKNEAEVSYAAFLDNLTPLERHNTCHEQSKLRINSFPSEDWNLWACYCQSKYLQNVSADKSNELFGTGKRLKPYFYKDNEELTIKFGSPSNRKYNIHNLVCDNFLFPYFLDMSNLQLENKSSFTSAQFCGYANFSSTIFSNVINFNRAKFFDTANFENTRFEVYSHFVGTTFNLDAIFTNALFIDTAFFTSSVFKTATLFDNSTFSAILSFKYNEFYGITDFSSSKFTKNSKLKRCYFFRDFIFRDVVGEMNIDFSNSCFFGESNFSGTHFMRSAIFHRCAFGTITKNQINKFTPIKLKNSIDTYKCDPQDDIVPNFTSTTFSIPPNLSYIDMPSLTENYHELTAAKFRRLKELSSAGENHIEEAKFFRLEMLARRDHEVNGIQANLITIYEWLSLCGLSIKRPFSALIASTLLFWLLYIAMRSDFSIVQLQMVPFGDLFIYSTHNALPLIGANSDQKLALVNTLFGGYETRPIYFAIASFIQNLIGLGLYFLILLAIRNYFRMR